ncbi:MAG: hypothetical protein OXM02_05765, partial [Bacteroidota bacterium]|nr:hypothetical protein [Bacteroidota bacterium]
PAATMSSATKKNRVSFVMKSQVCEEKNRVCQRIPQHPYYTAAPANNESPLARNIGTARDPRGIQGDLQKYGSLPLVGLADLD